MHRNAWLLHSPIHISPARRYGTYIHKKNLRFQHPCFRNKLEKNHAFIRYILPKGSHFSDLTHEDATWMIIISTAQQEPV